MTYQQTPINSKCCYIWYRLAVISSRKLCAPCGEELGGWELRQSKTHPRLPTISQHKVLLYLLPFGQNSNVKLWPLNSTPQFSGLGWAWRGENGTNRNVDPTLQFDFYTRYRPTCTVWPQYTTQHMTDRASDSILDYCAL